MRPQFLLLRDQLLFSAKPPPTKLSWSDHLKNLALGLAALVTSIAIPLVGIYYTDRQKEREIIAANARTEIEQRQKDKELGK
jgi:hypothetical protein